MSASRSRLIAAAGALALSLGGMVAQLGLRLLFSAELGAGAAYDRLLLALIPASLLAQVAFQALASALIPRLAAAIAAGEVARAWDLERRAARLASLIALAGAGLAALFAGDAAATLAPVLLAWGWLAGLSILRRQLLLSFDAPLKAGLLPILPGLVILAGALLSPAPGDADAALAMFLRWSLAGHALAAWLGARWAAAGWRAQGAARPRGARWSEVAPALGAAWPILLASANAQLMTAIDQGVAALWAVGGLSTLSCALAVARLPLSLGDSLMYGLGYGRLVRAAARWSEAGGPGADARSARRELRQAAARLLELQALLVLPAVALMLVAGDDIARLLFARGAFDDEAARGVGELIRWAAPLLLGQLLPAALVPVIVALGRARVVLRLELGLTLLSAVLNLLLVPVFGLGGLLASSALATALFAWALRRSLAELGLAVELRGLAAPARAAIFCGLVGGLARGLLYGFGDVVGGASWGAAEDAASLRLALLLLAMGGAYLAALAPRVTAILRGSAAPAPAA